jgi:hypothetical protein
MVVSESIDERRAAMRENSEYTFVERDEFCRLMLSTRRLVRSDEPRLQYRGLMDLDTGARFLIEHEELYAR